MTITGKKDNEKYIIAVEGKLNTTTAPELEAELTRVFADEKNLVLDFSALDYLSSAGLRVLVGAEKKATAMGGSVVITGCNETIKEIFDITGLADVLTIQ